MSFQRSYIPRLDTAAAAAGGLIYVSGGDLKHRNGSDVYYKFRPNSNFVYLTGISEPGFACLLDPETQRFTLVAPKVSKLAIICQNFGCLLQRFGIALLLCPTVLPYCSAPLLCTVVDAAVNLVICT